MTDPEIFELAIPWCSRNSPSAAAPAARAGMSGGDGSRRRIRFLEPMTAVIVSSRRNVAPFGVRRAAATASAGTAIGSTRAGGARDVLTGHRTRPSWRPATCSSSRRRAAEATGRRDGAAGRLTCGRAAGSPRPRRCCCWPAPGWWRGCRRCWGRSGSIPEIVELASAALGRRVTIEGRIGLDLFPEPVLTAERVSLGGRGAGCRPA
jgi:hypothetical protein